MMGFSLAHGYVRIDFVNSPSTHVFILHTLDEKQATVGHHRHIAATRGYHAADASLKVANRDEVLHIASVKLDMPQLYLALGSPY